MSDPALTPELKVDRRPRRLSRTFRRAVRHALARLRRQTFENGHAPARTCHERQKERRQAIGAVRAGRARTFAKQEAPAPERTETRWCKTCKANTSHRGGTCENHVNQHCPDCGRLTLWKGGICTEHAREYCSSCGKTTSHRGRTCLSSEHPNAEVTQRWCDTCRANTEHRSNKCQGHGWKHCAACKRNTEFKANHCSEHTTGWCDVCDTNTPQLSQYPYTCLAPNHG